MLWGSGPGECVVLTCLSRGMRSLSFPVEASKGDERPGSYEWDGDSSQHVHRGYIYIYI